MDGVEYNRDEVYGGRIWSLEMRREMGKILYFLRDLLFGDRE